MINRKAKGTKGERDLVKFFNENGWACVRVAGSGSSSFPSPDILAGNGFRRLAIECKVTKDKKKYFSGEEIAQLQSFAANFGSEAWVGVKFPDLQWYFIILEDLEETNKNFVISKEKIAWKGLNLQELLEKSDNLLARSENNQ